MSWLANAYETVFQSFRTNDLSSAIPALERILADGDLYNDLATVIRYALAVCPTSSMNELTVDMRTLGDSLWEPLATALEQNKSLKTLRIVKMYDDHSYVNACGWKALARVIKHNCSFRRLSMKGSFGGDDESPMVWATLLAEGLRHNKTLKYVNLNLVGPCIYDDGEFEELDVAFADAITHNTVLEVMHIHGLNFSGNAMAEAFKQNTSLTTCTIWGKRPPQLNRNKELHELCRSLSQLAKTSSGFHSLKDIEVRRMLFFCFFIPEGCVPAQAFLDMMDCSGLPKDEHMQDVLPELCPVVPDSVSASASTVGNEAAAGDGLEGKTDNADIAEVLLRSKEDGPPPLSGDGQTVFKITRMALADETVEALLNNEELANCRARVIEAGCEVRPTWAGGATLFVPFTEEQFADLRAVGKELEKHHIVALRSDLDSINAALKAVRCRKRARISFAEDFCDLPCPIPVITDQTNDEEIGGPAVVEETFFPSTDSSIANRYVGMTLTDAL